MLFCGIDLHSNNCLVVVSDDNDKVVYSNGNVFPRWRGWAR